MWRETNWRQLVVDDNTLHGEYIQSAPGTKEPRRFHPDTRAFLILFTTQPLEADGKRLARASNLVAAEMSRMVELAEANDFAAARAVHDALMPIMTVNFVESNPIPVKCAMAMLGRAR